MSRALVLLVVSLALVGAGLGFAAGEASACKVSVGTVCLVPGNSPCDPDGTCYPCDPRPGHPLDC